MEDSSASSSSSLSFSAAQALAETTNQLQEILQELKHVREELRDLRSRIPVPCSRCKSLDVHRQYKRGQLCWPSLRYYKICKNCPEEEELWQNGQ